MRGTAWGTPALWNKTIAIEIIPFPMKLILFYSYWNKSWPIETYFDLPIETNFTSVKTNCLAVTRILAVYFGSISFDTVHHWTTTFLLLFVDPLTLCLYRKVALLWSHAMAICLISLSPTFHLRLFYSAGAGTGSTFVQSLGLSLLSVVAIIVVRSLWLFRFGKRTDVLHSFFPVNLRSSPDFTF